MLNSIFNDKLDTLKQNERPEVVLMVADNQELIKLTIAWMVLDIHHNEELSELHSDSEKEIWDWLWQNTSYSLVELKEKADIAISEKFLEKKIKPLIGNHIIYPDGTINSYVQRYLKECVVKLFEARHTKSKKR